MQYQKYQLPEKFQWDKVRPKSIVRAARRGAYNTLTTVDDFIVEVWSKLTRDMQEKNLWWKDQ